MIKPLPDLLKEIEALKKELETLRPLNQGELRALQLALKVEFTHHSNAIEGNSLTLGETQLVLEEGLTIGGKTLREINEVVNHNALFVELYKVVTSGSKLNEALVLGLHKLVLKNIDDENAGVYRNIQVQISGEAEPLPRASAVPSLLAQCLLTYDLDTSIVLQAANFHYDFVKIHPFVDGNGRTVRILMNIILMQAGYPLMIIPKIRRAEYIKTLNSTSSRDDFVQFFTDVLLQNMKDYKRMINA